MLYDTHYRHNEALSPEALGTLPAALHALNAGVDDCKRAGKPIDRDASVLLLIRNLNRFKEPEFAKDFPVVSSVFQRLARRDIVYLAALFHDIAKGRGGDHSELGAQDAIQFCRTHGFTERECKLVAWLIQSHLLMSVTAQKKDISDPDVVQEFAEKMGDMQHLD